ncbi:hypothetical protein CAPTEDRAFT_140344, partial [Capitella teleta]
QVFEQLEDERIKFLRNEMWVIVNIFSVTLLECDELCEKVRKDLEKCSVDEDIMDFINTHHTGREKPGEF